MESVPEGEPSSTGHRSTLVSSMNKSASAARVLHRVASASIAAVALFLAAGSLSACKGGS